MKKLICLCVALLSLASLAWAATKPVILSTTTSTRDSGLLDVLVPQFEKESGYQVKTIAGGSGQAMKVEKYGVPLFFPDAGKNRAALGL